MAENSKKSFTVICRDLTSVLLQRMRKVWSHTLIENRSCCLQVVNGGRPSECFAVIRTDQTIALPLKTDWTSSFASIAENATGLESYNDAEH
jgi:hypothetical protein